MHTKESTKELNVIITQDHEIR